MTIYMTINEMGITLAWVHKLPQSQRQQSQWVFALCPLPWWRKPAPHFDLFLHSAYKYTMELKSETNHLSNMIISWRSDYDSGGISYIAQLKLTNYFSKKINKLLPSQKTWSHIHLQASDLELWTLPVNRGAIRAWRRNQSWMPSSR